MKLILCLGFSVMFVGCSAFKGDGRVTSASIKGSCSDSLKAVFATTYQPFLTANCAGCHGDGGIGRGAFASSNVTQAFEEFQLRGYQLVGDRALSAAHQPPFTGPQLQPDIDAIIPQWEVGLAEVAGCDDSDGDIPLPDDEPLPTSATYTSSSQVIGATEDVKTMTWDLSTEIELPAGTTRPGASFSVDIQTDTSPTGTTSYLFLNPVLTTGGESLRIAYVEIFINGDFMGNASTYRGIDRYVPANDQRELSQTTMVVPFEFAATDTLQIAFGILDPADFNPSTFTQLTDDIFTQSCNGCHSAANPAGGLDMTDYNGMLAQYIAIPYSLAGSEVYKRMNDEANPMPPAGLLPEAQRNSVRDWIRDGAPE